MSTTKGSKAIAVMQYVAKVEDFDQALAIFETLGSTHEPVDDVLDSMGVMRYRGYEYAEGEEFWQMIEEFAAAIDIAHEHFGENK
jgi:hypothetical protein